MVFLEEVVQKILNEKEEFLNLKNRVALIRLNGNKYTLKFHESAKEEDRINDALELQKNAKRNGFFCNLPLNSFSGRFTVPYSNGLVSAYEYVEGNQLDSNSFCVNEVTFFIKEFFKFQKDYNPAKVRYFKKGLSELILNPLFNCISLSEIDLKHLQILSKLDEKIFVNTSIIHGDILPKNIVRNPSGNLFLIDFERVMKGSLAYEVASSIFYSFLATNSSLKEVYASFSKKLDEENFNLPYLKECIANKSAEYLVFKKFGNYLNRSKEKEVKKAERFFSESIDFLNN